MATKKQNGGVVGKAASTRSKGLGSNASHKAFMKKAAAIENGIRSLKKKNKGGSMKKGYC